MRLKRILVVLVGVAVLGLAAGCGASAPSMGWSGAYVSGSNLYIGSMDGRVESVNADSRSQRLHFPDGEKGEWAYKTAAAGNAGFLSCSAPPPSPVYGTPTLSGQYVYVATYAGRVYALYANSGQERWVYPDMDSKEELGTIVGGILINNGRAFFGTSKGVYCLDAATGSQKWFFPTGGKVWTLPKAQGTGILVTCFDGNLYSLSADGQKLWSFKAPAAIASSPAVVDGSILFGAFDRYLYCVKSDGGSVKWKFQGDGWFWAEPEVKNGIVFAPSLDGKVYALKLDSGEKVWQFTGESQFIADPVMVENFLVAVSENGQVYILDSSNGEKFRNIGLSTSVRAPLSVSGGTVYVHGINNYLFAVSVPSGEILWKTLLTNTGS
jgi:outer membrane protein assembly factor BamB